MSKNGKRYGVCENFDNCNNAKNRKVIELDELDDFVCPECHSELHEIKKEGGIKPKLIVIIAALVVLLGGGGAAAYLLYFNQPKVKEICLNKTKAEIELPEGFFSFLYDTLTVTTTPKIDDAKYVWSSSNEELASVTDGVVAIKDGNGEVTIRVALADNPQIKDSCLYTITYQPEDEIPSTISLNKTKDIIELSTNISSFYYDTLIVTPKLEDVKYLWSSNDELASVADGIVSIKGGIKCDKEVTITVALADNPQVRDSCIYTITTKTVDDGNTSGKVDLGYAIYDGPRKNGKPNGMGGTVTFKRAYSIDLKKAPAEYVDVYKGDKIVNTKFIDGRLVQGEIHFTDGTRRWINI